jgi:hypothetical protein
MLLPAGSTSPVPVTYGQLRPVAVATDSSYVYWWSELQGGQGIRKISKSQMDPVVDVASGPRQSCYIGMTCHGYSLVVGPQYLHWLYDGGDGTALFVAPLSGGDGKGTLIGTLGGHSSPGSLKTDGSSVYWLASAVLKAPLAGGTVTNLFENGRRSEGIDLLDGFVYVLNEGASSNWTIKKIAASGGPPATSQRTADSDGGESWIGTDGVNLCYTSYCTGYYGRYSIWRQPVSGGAAVAVANAPEQPYTVVLAGSYVYWTESTGGSVRRAPK